MESRQFALAVALVLTATIGKETFAQAVQLPTFQFFTVQTTVSVPDRGGAYLGGVRRAASGSVSRGVPLLSKVPGVNRLARNEAIGAAVGSSGIGLTATIIDHRELDEAVLAAARERRDALARVGEPIRAAAAPPTNLAIPATAPVASVADLRIENERQEAARRQEAAAWLEKARRAEAAGKAGVAQIYYQMASRRAEASPALRE